MREVPEVIDQSKRPASAGSAWAEVPTITNLGARRGPQGAGAWGRNPDWGRRVGRFSGLRGLEEEDELE